MTDNQRGRREGSPSNIDNGTEMPKTASIQLANRKHEIFARFVANGETYTRAYELAGYNPSNSNSSTMANRPEIAERIAVLKAEKDDRDLKFQIEMRKANLDPDNPQVASREVAEWSVKQVLDLFWENARLAQVAGQFTTANESLKIIASILGLTGQSTGNKNDKPSGTQVGIAIYQDAARQLEQGGGVSIDGAVNPLAPRVSSS